MPHNSSSILIVYASYGHGHYQAAKSLQASLLERGVPHVTLLDVMAESHPWINTITQFIYMQSFTTIPHLYGWVYYNTRKMKATSLFGKALHSLGIRSLQAVLEQEQPDLVIHTFPQLVLPTMKNRWQLTMPLVNILTDYDLHGRWLHPHIDHYYVPSIDMKHDMLAQGVPSEQISVSGIPLRADFDQSLLTEQPLVADVSKRKQLRIQAGLRPEHKTVLLLAGAYGVLKNVREVCDQLAERSDTQVIVICGKNESLLKELHTRYNEHPAFTIIGFTDRMNEWMMMSDCVITKPGGVTVAECIHCALPMFLLKPVPGQELANALYLQSYQAAEVCDSSSALAERLMMALDQPEVLSHMQTQLRTLQTPQASSYIADDLIERYLSQAHAAQLRSVSLKPNLQTTIN